MLEVFRRRSIQFDPLAVAGRNHDLVLHARVADYDPAWCELLYERRKIFEAYNKVSLVPTSEFAWFRGNLSRSAPKTLDENADVAAHVLERIRAEGPMSSLDFERQRGSTTDWFGAETNVVRAVLEAYAVTGVLGLARRDGNRRYYDLLDRLLPPKALARKLPLEEQIRYKLLSRYRAHGLLGISGAGDVFGGIGPAKPDERWPGYPGRNALRDELVNAEISFPSTSRASAGNASSSRRTPHSWRRRRTRHRPSRSFPRSIRSCGIGPSSRACSTSTTSGSSSSPPAKRRWGWYVLPIVFGERFVGRIEPRIDRDNARVDVLGLWWEDGFAPRRADGFIDAMRDALRAYLGFAGANRLAWASHLGSEKRLFLTQP